MILIAELGISVIIFLYAAYISFTIRRGLVVPLYRSRSLWLGILAILWSITFIFFNRIDTLFPNYFEIAAILFYYGAFLPTLIFFFVWLDRTISTLIRLDFRRKDIVGWRRGRFLYWGALILGVILYVLGTGYYFLGIVNPVTTFAANVGVVPAVVAVAYAAVVLIVGSIRTRDLTFRNHTKWLGLSAVALLAVFILPNPATLYTLPAPFFAYFWYRMARSLVPVNKLTIKDRSVPS